MQRYSLVFAVFFLTILANLRGFAQTQIDLRTQSKSVDFSAATMTRPSRIGTVAGSTCQVGETFFKTDAAAGNNLFGCTAPNVWTLLGGTAAAGATTSGQLGDLAVTRASATVLNIATGCQPATPCNVRFGNTVYTLASGAAATISAGTGTAYLYISASGILTIGHAMTLMCSAGCMAVSGVTAFPADSLPLATWTSTSGSWDTAGGRDLRAWISAKPVSGGQGVLVSESGGRATVSIDSSVVPMFLLGSASLAFPSIPNASCATDLTFSLNGALTTDEIAPGWPSALPAGLFGIMRVSAANTVAVRLCNLSGAAVTPPAATYGAAIVRSF